MAQEADIRSSLVSPEFLHGNSTSHTWVFSAVAELIDNAYDPDVNASELRIDTRIINETDCLTFVDNGNGMTQDKLHKMLSFGYCEKKPVGQIKPIGYYGNGFKSGSMRLGKDAIVFTRNKDSMSVGLLSQTYLKNINAKTVLVPIVTWELPSRKRRDDQITNSNLNAILQNTIFKTEEELLAELSGFGMIGHGTNIIIYNLKITNNNLELDFISDTFDIRNPETSINDLTSIERPTIPCQPEYRRSLREYCSILYLKPRMKIVIRGKSVKTKLMSKSLSQTEKDRYKPRWLDKPIHITFGFTSSKNPEDYGIMMYHKNRLIKAFEKVGYQKQLNDIGVGVVGVVEANFLDPIHNKQDFNRTEKYSAFITNLSQKLNDYWNEKTNGVSAQNWTSMQKKLPDWTWVQCDNCSTWRRLPAGITAEELPEYWFCRMNPDATFNRCDIPEEPEDEDEALQKPVYKKTYKKKLKEKKQAEEYENKRKSQEKDQELKQQEAVRHKSIEGSVSEESEHNQWQPTQHPLGRKRKRASVNEDGMEEKQTINLQTPKKITQGQRHEMLRTPEQFKFRNINTNTAILFEDTSSCTVSFSSSLKQKSTDKGQPQKIFLDDDTTLTFAQNTEVKHDFYLGDLQKMDTEVKHDFYLGDLQKMDKDDEQDIEQELNISQQDVKPSKEELNQAILLCQSDVALVHQTVQTEPVVILSATEDEVNFERMSPLEKSQQLAIWFRQVCKLKRKLKDTNSKFKSLQVNICKLIKLIDPDFECGQPNKIEEVILDFIRVRMNANSD